MSDPAFRIDVRVRNNRILRAIERLGFASTADFCRDRGLAYGVVVSYVGLKDTPIAHEGGWKNSALTLADALFADPEDLWPKEARAVLKNRFSIEVTGDQMRELTGGNHPSIDALETGDNHRILQQAMGELSKNERRVIEAWFYEGKTLREASQKLTSETGLLGLSVERTRQIAMSALRKLRERIPRLAVPSERGLPGVLATDEAIDTFVR